MPIFEANALGGEEVVVEYEFHAAEKATRDYPGSPAYCEILRVVRMCDGRVMDGQLTSLDFQGLEEQALAHHAAQAEALADEAADRATDARREGER